MNWLVLMVGVMGVMALAATAVAWQQHRRAARWRIRAEEADAWSDEYQRERDAMARQLADLVGENRALRETRGALQDLVALRTRQLLAVNYAFIAYHAQFRKRD